MRTLSYPHPGDLDGTPAQVARRAVAELAEAAETSAEHTRSAVQQIRSGFLSDRLAREPELSPEALARLWDRSPEAAACVSLMRASRHHKRAAERLQAVCDK